MTDQKTEHTPLPWTNVEGNIGNTTTKEGVVFHEGIYGESVKQAEANAAFIVQACNAYDGLVSAIQKVMPFLEKDLELAIENNFGIVGNDPLASESCERVLACRQALKDAGVEVGT